MQTRMLGSCLTEDEAAIYLYAGQFVLLLIEASNKLNTLFLLLRLSISAQL